MFKVFLSTILITSFLFAHKLTRIQQDIVLKYTLYLPQKITNIPKAPLNTEANVSEVTDWKKSLAIPSHSMLKHFGIGFNEDDFLKLKKITKAYAITIKFKQLKTLSHHKDSDNYLYSMLKNNNGYLYDEETREMYKPSSWKKRRVIEGWKDKKIAIHKHITIHYYPRKTNEHRLITLGMAKFGLPDIAIEDIFSRTAKELSNLINLTAYTLLDNRNTNAITINLDKLANSYAYARKLKKHQYKNHKEEITLGFKKAHVDEGDPTNRIIELTFKSNKNEQRYSTQARYLAELFGAEDKIYDTNKYHNELEAASKKDLAMLPEIKRLFNKKLGLNEYIVVKVPFSYSEGREWMWVSVTSWKGNKIKGILNNKPYYIKDLHAGDAVEVNQKDVFDFLYHHSDGTETGNETTKVILKYN